MDNLALQKMMHDLKAPLTALKILRARRQLGHSEDCLLKATLHSLENLLARCVGETHPGPKAMGEDKIEQLCAALISEKRLLFTNEFNLSVQTSGASLRIASIDLHKILSNLLQNAGEACRSTGGQVSLAVAVHAGRLEFTVRDQGSGMDALALAALKRGTPLKSRGWGVGLLIVRELVAQSGGRLEFCSELGYGSAAKVSWPL